MFKKVIAPIILSTIWISLSEFVRNEFFLKAYWINHYETLGLIFPSETINGAVWGIWALVFSVVIFIIQKRFTFFETAALSWVFGFLMMWLVTGNMMVLPFGILTFTIPLSLLEVVVAIYILRRFN